MSIAKKTTSLSTGQTQQIAIKLAKDILKKPTTKQAVVVALEGDLGSGKTTFIQGFAKGLGIKENITSPTFTIIKRYDSFYHIDCYRLDKPEEILDLGWQEIISNPKNIIAIEWPKKIKPLLPKITIWYRFKLINRNKREIVTN